MSESENRAYAAGVVDGEGTIAINRHRNNPRYNWSYGLFCSVTNTNLDLLNWLELTFGLGVVRPQTHRSSKPHWKPKYAWVLRVEEIPLFLPLIQPYLLVKRRQAELMLEFIEGTRYTGMHRPLTPEEVIRKHEIFTEIGRLNMRGIKRLQEVA